MKNTGFDITVPKSYSPISVLSAECNSYITWRFKVHETLQINQFNSQFLNNAFV